MFQRLVFRSIKACSRAIKLLTLSLVVITSVLSSTVPAQAQTQTLDSLNTTYKNFFELFGTTKDGKVVSGISKYSISQKTQNGDIDGLILNVNLGFDTIRNSTEWYWNRVVANERNNAFIIKLCEQSNPNNCWLNTIDFINQDNGTKAIYVQTKDGKYNESLSLSLSAFGTNNGVSSAVTNTGTKYKFNNQTKTTTTWQGLVIPKGAQLKASLWYCAGRAGSDDGTSAIKQYESLGFANNRLTRFSKDGDAIQMCGSTSYFMIGNEVDISIPSDTTQIDQLITQGGQELAQKTVATTTAQSSNLPECAIGVVGETKIVGCFARLVYYLIYWPIAWVAGFFGKLFDFFLGYTLNDESYRFAFAVTGWKIVRDIANIFFIIILVWTGFATVLGFANVSMKKVVPSVIINALLINFSLLFTRVVIDMSNVVGRVFYGQINVCATENCLPLGPDGNPVYKTDGTGGFKPISEAIVNTFNPQKVFEAQNLLPGGATTGSESDVNYANPGSQNNAGGEPMTDNEYAGYFIIVSLFAAGIMFFIMKMFWQMSIFFLGRVVGLYVAMIFSPFAFLSMGDVPLVGSISRLKWKDWFGELTNYALLAPMFLFFLYIVYGFMQKQSEFVNLEMLKGSTGGFLEGVLYICIPMGIIYILITKGLGYAKTYAGEIGNALQSKVDSITGGVGGVIGGTVGLAAGGAAFLGRNGLGRGITAIANTKTGRKVMVDGKEVDETRAMRAATDAPTSSLARWTNQMYKGAKTGSFDVRNAGTGINIGGKEQSVLGLLSKGFGEGGITLKDTVSGKLGIDEKAGEGGIKKIDKARVDARQKKNDAQIDYSHLSDDAAKAVWQQHKDRKIEESGIADWKKDENINKDSALKPIADSLKNLQDQEKDLKKQERAKQEELTIAEQVGDANRIAIVKTELQTIRENIERTEQNKTFTETKLLEKQKEVITQYENDGKRSEAAVLAARTAESKRLDSYGKVKDGKALATAMRGEYATELKKDSFWMKDGKPRFLPAHMAAFFGGAFGAMLDAFTPGFGTMISAIILSKLGGGYVDHLGNIHVEAADASIKTGQKSQGKGSKAQKLEATVEKFENLIKEAFTLTNKKFDANNSSEDDIETAISEKLANIDIELRAPGLTPGQRKKKEREKKAYEKVVEDWEKAKEALDKFKADQKKDEEKK